MNDLEARVARVAAAQRAQRERWAEEGRCEDCGTEDDVTEALDQSRTCPSCAVKRTLAPRTWA